MTELGESAFTEKSLGKRFCTSPSVAKREKTVWETQRVADTKMQERSGDVRLANLSTSLSHEKKGKGGNAGEEKKGSGIYVGKERSKTAKVQWHLCYPVRVSD